MSKTTRTDLIWLIDSIMRATGWELFLDYEGTPARPRLFRVVGCPRGISTRLKMREMAIFLDGMITALDEQRR